MAIKQLFVDQRLGQEVEGAEADGLDRRLDRAVAGNHDDGGGGLVLAAMGQQIEAVAVAQPDIHQHEVVGLAVDGRMPSARLVAVSVGNPVAEPIGHRAQHVTVVVHQQKRSRCFMVSTAGLLRVDSVAEDRRL